MKKKIKALVLKNPNRILWVDLRATSKTRYSALAKEYNVKGEMRALAMLRLNVIVKPIINREIKIETLAKKYHISKATI